MRAIEQAQVAPDDAQDVAGRDVVSGVRGPTVK
jgi:hypothetical protein